MGCLKCLSILLLLSGLAMAILIGYLMQPKPRIVLTDLQYWGPQKVSKASDVPKDDIAIRQFKIDFDPKMIADLRSKLADTKFVEPLEDAKYHYGVNGKTFTKVITYWKDKYDFNKQLALLNAYPHYLTQIEGLDIHFFRSRPAVTDPSKVKVIPIMMLHGWPGSFVEFLKISKMMSQAKDGIAFDVIVPSIPGYGYSQVSSKQGLNAFVTARIFTKLMQRLGYDNYYVQGGDWGALITASIGELFPEKVRGLHMNMAFGDHGNPLVLMKELLFNVFPNQLGDGVTPPCMTLCPKQRWLKMLREMGYMHIQATKPDTIGFALLNNPAGLAGYILEKFSTWTVDAHRDLEDGGLTKKFTLDDMLTNVMVYHATGSIATSQRYYRENFASDAMFNTYNVPINVPTGFAIFPNELACVPRFVMEGTYTNITQFTYPEDGGHFAAFEVPQLLEKDVRSFVKTVETKYPHQWKGLNDWVAAKTS